MVEDIARKPRFANVYSGTSTGVIRTTSPKLIGCRIVKDEHFGTIKFVGTIANSSIEWLGVDWDDQKYGRHDGTFKNRQYFTAHHPTSGSFLKPVKASFGTSLEEALVTRYAMCAECQIYTRNAAFFQPGGDPCSGIKFETDGCAGKLKATMDMSALDAEFVENAKFKSNTPFTVEIFTTSSGEVDRHQYCGADGANKKLSSLRVASVPGMPVFRALREGEILSEDVRTLWPGIPGRMSEYLGALRELDLSACLISKWIEVVQICYQLPLLCKLNVSCNRLRLPYTAENKLADLSEIERRLISDVDTDIEDANALCFSAFPALTRFVAVQMLNEKEGGVPFGWQELTQILSWMPNLREICVANNELGDLPFTETKIDHCLANILCKFSEIDLTGTGQTSFSRILAVLGHSTSLNSLIISGNQISEITLPDDEVLLPTVTELTIRDNLINDWASINALSRFPALINLIVSKNPILETTTPETARQEVIARLPKLITLNRQDVERDERRGAELDFLKRYGRAWAEAEKQGEEHKVLFKKKYPSFHVLCEKHGAPESGETKTVIHALKEGLIGVTISCEPTPTDGPKEILKRIPSRMTVNHLRTLARRLFRLPVTASIDLITSGFRLGFENVEVPLDSDTREIGFFGVISGDKIVARWFSE